MMALHSEIKNLIILLGFSLEEGATGVWIKNFPIHNYRLNVDFVHEEINYGDKIILGDRTTCNFNNAENFVVLECVNRLLEKGYPPEHITLEKDYPLGHNLKGKLDILVTDKDNKAYLMIECKTWGGEYDKAVKKTLKDGGQIISYFQQDRAAKFLSLYTSRIEANVVQFSYGIIKVEPDFATATNTQEIFEYWNKNLKDNGIFEANSTPYNITIKSLTKNRLTPLTKDDSSRIFNQFSEILRHNVVSDKPNAFNKLITLLLCKIVDEDRGEEDELHFQWLETDTNISLQKRLNYLYKIGMERYLTKIVTDYSDDDVDEIAGLSPDQKDRIKYMMTELRLKKNNEFAFKEVFNEDSFVENSKVLKEVLELLQPYQVRYNKKQQFLGDFFELLLNTSIKQEAGQFFTPVPIARFIINSIPLKELMINKINKGDSDFLPYVIDYAVGSGHFLTEAMDEIHSKVKELHLSGEFTKPSVRNNLSKWSEDYDWAYNFVYGIEKDYRLVKTAKVSCFLNGDGLARIFNADGLANFQTDIDYKDKLKETSKANSKDNQQFEVLIANPPYSVSAFKNTLKNGDKSFELYKRLTDESSEIECLFIERAKQLLKDGGYAGIILPSSILSNTGIYEDARAIILKYFKVVAITEFSSGTFMATGTNTVTLFLERRNNADWLKVEHSVNSFFTNSVDVSSNGIDMPFGKYVSHVFKSVSFDDYISFVRSKPNGVILKHEIFLDYRAAFDNSTPIKNLKKKAAFKNLCEQEKKDELERLFNEQIIKVEKEKMMYFILAYPQKTLLIKSNPSGKNDSEKEFLGYEFSNRRGHEGIKAYGAKTIQQATKLYDENTALNPEKVNTYIYNAFLGNNLDIQDNLQNNIYPQDLVDMLNFERVEFIKSISLASKKKDHFKSQWEFVRLNSVAEILSGGTPDTNVSEYWNGDINWATLVDTKQKYLYKTERQITELGLKNSSAQILPINTVIFSSRATIGDVTIAKVEVATNQGYKSFICDTKKIHFEYLYYILKHEAKNIAEISSGATYLEISKSEIGDFKIPLPPIDVQMQVIDAFRTVEDLESQYLVQIQQHNLQIEALIKSLEGEAISFKELININPSKTETESYSNDTKVSFIEMASISNDGYVTKIAIRELGDVKKGFTFFKNNDVLFAKITPCMENGKGALVANLPTEFGFGSTEFFVLRSSNKILSSLLYQIVKQKTFRADAEKNMTGTSGHRRVPKEFLETYKVALPSIVEQQTIVNTIEEIEDKITVLQEQIETFKVQKELILKSHL
jgi:type I restriction enzyme M protein